MLPQYVAHEGGRPRDELLAAHRADVLALRARELLQRHALERELARRPAQPGSYRSLAPLSGIWWVKYKVRLAMLNIKNVVAERWTTQILRLCTLSAWYAGQQTNFMGPVSYNIKTSSNTILCLFKKYIT